MHDTVGLLFEESEFISTDVFTVTATGQGIGLIWRLNTETLHNLISVWLETSLELPFEEVVQHCRLIDDCLQTAYAITYRLVKSPVIYVDEKLLLSFMCLGNTIENGMRLVFNRCFYDRLPARERNVSPDGWVPGHRGWDAPPSLLQKLVFNGWCRYEVEILRRDLEINEVIYASQLQRYGNRGRHVNCRSSACIANTVDELTYQTQHRFDCQDKNCQDKNCQDVEFDYQEICNILERGQTPLVASDPRSGRLEFAAVPDVVPRGPHKGLKLPYICISHVWSHGLGNTKRNTLPRCQLEALHKYTLPLLQQGITNVPVSFFWIDTICVPVRPENANLRKKAISNVAQVYEQALQVLVLDEALMRTSLKADPSVNMKESFRARGDEIIRQKELVMCILFSDWWRRLWTLQEGLLTNSLCVLFREGIVNLGEAVQAGAEDHVKNRADLSSDTVKNALPNLIDKSGFLGLIGRLPRHRQILTLLCNRSTSRAIDEPVCLATLLGVDVRSILDTPGPQRMQKLYTSLGTIPAGLVFLGGPKLDVEGFRWAPRSLIIEGGPTMRYLHQSLSEEEDEEASVTANGIRFQGTGYPLLSLGVPLKNNFYIFPGPPRRVPASYQASSITDRQTALSRKLTVTAVIGAGLEHRGWKMTSTGEPEQPIAKDDLTDPVLVLAKKRRLEVPQNPGILVSNPKIKIDGAWHARYLCSVYCFTNSMAMWAEGQESIKSRLELETDAMAQGTPTGLMAWVKQKEPLKEWHIS